MRRLVRGKQGKLKSQGQGHDQGRVLGKGEDQGQGQGHASDRIDHIRIDHIR